MLYQYNIFSNITGKTKEFILENSGTDLLDGLKKCAKLKADGGGCSTKKVLEKTLEQIKLLENPPNKLEDNPDWVIYNEKKLLGVGLSSHSTDDVDAQFCADTTCKEFANGKKAGLMTFLVEIKAVKKILTKKNKEEMAFLTIEDSTCSISDICVFPKDWAGFSSLLYEGAVVVISGEKDKKSGSLIVKKVVQI